MVTKIELNKITDKKSLHIQLLYSLENVDAREWQGDYSFLTNFADKQHCKSITFDTRHERVMALGRAVGFREVQRSFEYELTVGGSYGQ